MLLFVRCDERGCKLKFTQYLDDFEDFCHYIGDTGWDDKKQVIVDTLAQDQIFIFNGNDTAYYIIGHTTWDFDFSALDCIFSDNGQLITGYEADGR